MTKKAACIILVNSNTQSILAVARRGTENDWGFPGGKKKYFESLKQCAVRELREETGVLADPQDLYELYLDKDYKGFEVVTYIATQYDARKLEQGDAGPVSWVSWDELCSGSFGDYNKAAKNKIEELISSELGKSITNLKLLPGIVNSELKEYKEVRILNQNPAKWFGLKSRPYKEEIVDIGRATLRVDFKRRVKLDQESEVYKNVIVFKDIFGSVYLYESFVENIKPFPCVNRAEDRVITTIENKMHNNFIYLQDQLYLDNVIAVPKDNIEQIKIHLEPYKVLCKW